MVAILIFLSASLLSTTTFIDDSAEFDFMSLNGANVHAVGIYETAHVILRVDDVRDWKNLAMALREHKNSISRIWELLDNESIMAIDDDEITKKEITGKRAFLHNKIINGLRKILMNPDFYSKKDFVHLKIDKPLQDLIDLDRKRSMVQTIILNRALLALLLPKAIKEKPEDYLSSSVKISKDSKVILVLSSCESCLWKIDLEPGARVMGVILIGYHSQDISGVDAPIIYKTHHDKFGKTTKISSVHAYSTNHRSYSALEKLVAEITGQKMSSFQGDYVARKGGYTIPKSK